MTEYDSLIHLIKKECADSWPGKVGDERAIETEEFIRVFTKQYSRILGFTELEILIATEQHRGMTAGNYYQRCYFPDFDKQKFDIYKTRSAFTKKFPSKKYICPSCEQVTTDMQVCNSGYKTGKSKRSCDWKSFGLFGTLGKGYKFFVLENFKEYPQVYEIFRPIELAD